MIRIEFLLVFIISINSKVVFSFYFSFLFSFNVVALTSSRLATLSPYCCTSIRRSIATADHSSHLVIISSPWHFFIHCFSIGIHISLLSLIFISTCRIYVYTSFQALTSSTLSHLSFEYLISLPLPPMDSTLAYTILSKEI